VTPPAFGQALNPRQRVRAAGLDPDHWYAVEYERALPPGASLPTRFWGTPITLWRDAGGGLHAVDDRRATRDRFGAVRPSAGVEGYPVRARYGFVWIFPGNPARAEEVPLPEVPELEGRDPWAYLPIDFTWRAHHSMVIDNLCDLSHAHLHRRFTSFHPGRLLKSAADADRVPLDARATRVFFVMMYDTLRVAALPVPLSHRAVRWLLRAAQPTVRSLLDQDGVALEAEQAGYEAHWTAPLVELNPAVSLLHRLTIRKWEAHLADGAVPMEVTA
jgi:phenylpropionate dioxygenase-like ring-hydroxylating dioxygenase large terminal subunit